MTPQEFIDSVYHDYLVRGITIGDPTFGRWEQAHHPIPKCKGGTETILLLKKDHAIHNLLQSEELNHPCVYGWEREYVPDGYSEIAEKWISIQRSIAGKSGNPHGKAIGGTKVGLINRGRGTNNLTKDVLSKAGTTTSRQVWESTVDGFRSNAGAVAGHNKARGWDPNARRRVN